MRTQCYLSFPTTTCVRATTESTETSGPETKVRKERDAVANTEGPCCGKTPRESGNAVEIDERMRKRKYLTQYRKSEEVYWVPKRL